MANSQGGSKLFSVRIVSIDYYMMPPIPDVDIEYSSFQGGKVKEVPVIRVFGSTPAGQKTCVHVHRALPYLYVPCSDIPLQSNPEGNAYENVVSLAVEKALKLKGNAGSKRQHVHGCSIVRGRKLYGYHSSEELFAKIYLYYPHDVSRAANLLLGGAILEKSLQPYESHLPFLLQFLVDYNLYGMGHMHLLKMKFRHPVPDVVFSKDAPCLSKDDCASYSSQADSVGGSYSGSPVWATSTVPDGWMWQFSEEPSASSNQDDGLVKRQSTCELEGDTTVEDILNQQLKICASLSQAHSDVKMVQSLIPIWEEEYERRGVHEIELPPDPGRPLARDVLNTLSDGVEYKDKLKELYRKAEDALLTAAQKDVGLGKPVRSSMEEVGLAGLDTQNPDRQKCCESTSIAQSLMLQESVSQEAHGALSDEERNLYLVSVDGRDTLKKSQESDSKAADSQAVALLNWLASSQAAEDINSDDELARDIILSPLLPASTIDGVLQKANTDYETESQQECQDILDSVDIDSLGRPKGNNSSNDQNNLPQPCLDKMIPQVDGAGDDQYSIDAANLSDTGMDIELMASKHQNLQATHSSLYGKRKRNDSLWGSLPLSAAPKVNDNIHCDISDGSDKCSEETRRSSDLKTEAQNCWCGEKTCSCSGAKDPRALLGCSVRDLMRKKRCYKGEPSESCSSEEELSDKEKKNLLPRKLEFHMEQFEEKNMTPFESSLYSHVCNDQQREIADSSPNAAAHSPFRCCRSHDIKSSSVNFSASSEIPSLSGHSCLFQESLLTTMHSSGCHANKGAKDASLVVTGQHDLPSCSGFEEQGCAVSADGPSKSPRAEVDSRVPVLQNISACMESSNRVVDASVKPGDDGKLSASCLSCLSTSETVGKIYGKVDYVSKVETKLGSNTGILHYMVPLNMEETDVATVTQHGKFGGREPCMSVLGERKGCPENIVMTFHKKPPTVGRVNDTNGKESSLPAFSNCASFRGKRNYVETLVQERCLDRFLPFFSEDHQKEGETFRKEHFGDCFTDDSAIGIPTHHQNDGSFSYLLTPAFSPPNAECVCKWLVLQDKGVLPKDTGAEMPENSSVEELEDKPTDACEKSLAECSPASSLKIDDLNQDQRIIDVGDLSCHTEGTCQDERKLPEVKEIRKFSQDISQISGPSERSKPTPLSQIGFRDPASVGGGQQLTLFSIEVQAESRGDLRSNPRNDAINIVAVAIQNDISSMIDIHVLVRSADVSYTRNLDSIPGGKVMVFLEERDLMHNFVKLMCSLDPDIIMGWDVQGGSLGFLAERAAHLGVSLLNNISRTPSETKAESKDLEVPDNGNADALASESLISDPVVFEDAIIEDEWGRTHASGVHVVGRIVLNVWRLMRGEVKLNMYTLEAVAEAVLRKKVPSIQWKVLNTWFSSGPGRARYRCIEYMVKRAKLNLEIMSQLDMINRTSELARVFGIDFFSVLSRGSQYRVESMLTRLAHMQNYVLISPGHQQVASQPAMECLPLVMEPESGFYSDPVVVLDFQSLYPSMIIAYNLCFSTCLGKVVPPKENTLGVSSYAPDLHNLKGLSEEILLTPNGVMYMPSKIRKGVLPRLLEEILSTRIMVKQAMKKLAPSQQILYRILNARQLALKLIANVTYGYTAAGFSGRMPCAELADSIVQCGRRTLEKAISFVNAHDVWDARVIYGDTDSMFVLLKGRSLEEAFRIGNEIASTITALNPNPVVLKMEKVYQPCFLLTKKRYVGYSYESVAQVKPIFDAKGIETVRRDTCAAVAKTLEKSLRIFFEHQDIFKVRTYLQRQWSRILSGRVSLQDFVFAKEVRLGTYSTRASSSLPPAAIVATKAMRLDPRAEPRYAQRIPYIVIHGEPGARLVDMVVDPQEVLAIDSHYRLNDLYYITKQIIPALQRVFGLVGADLNQWFQEMPRPVRDGPSKHYFNSSNPLRARIDFYYTSRHCILCGELVQKGTHLCDQCSGKGAAAVMAMTGKTSKLEKEIQHLVAICRHCGGGDWVVESGVKCTSLACAVYYERRKVQKELRALSSISSQSGFYPKCMVEWF